MSVGRFLALVLAVAMIAGGVFIALAGMGYVGKSGDTSQGWASSGAILAGLGVALVIVAVRPGGK